jgi:hypothetical protein
VYRAEDLIAGNGNAFDLGGIAVGLRDLAGHVDIVVGVGSILAGLDFPAQLGRVDGAEPARFGMESLYKLINGSRSLLWRRARL